MRRKRQAILIYPLSSRRARAATLACGLASAAAKCSSRGAMERRYDRLPARELARAGDLREKPRASTLYSRIGGLYRETKARLYYFIYVRPMGTRFAVI